MSHVSPNRHEIYFADSAHGTIVLPQERVEPPEPGGSEGNES